MNKFARFVKQNANAIRVIGAGAMATLPLFSHAAIDTSAATTGIADFLTAALAILGALTTAYIAVWGTRKVMRFFGR